MTKRHVHPVVFLFLILPFGALGGYLQVAIGFLLAQAGVSVEKIAALIAASYIPHVWKFAWAPIADTTLSRKAWYTMGAVVSAVGFWATGALPATRTALNRLTSRGGGLERRGDLPRHVGREPGWHTASPEEKAVPGLVPGGQLGGNGPGGGAGLWMAQHLPAPWMAVGLGNRQPALHRGLFFVPEPAVRIVTKNILKSLWSVAKDYGAWRGVASASSLCFCASCRSVPVRRRTCGRRSPRTGTPRPTPSPW
jgi:hypothetical protein